MGNRQNVTVETRAVCLLSLVGTVALAVSTTLTWASWNVTDAGSSLSLLELPVTPLIACLGIAIVALSALAGLVGYVRAIEVGGYAAASLALFAALSLIAAEAVAAVVPRFRFSATAQRLALGVAAGPGPWLMLVTGALVAAAAVGSLRREALALAARLGERGWAPLAALVVFALAVPPLLLLRHQVWVVAPLFGGELALSGDTLVPVGWVTLAAPAFLALGALCVCLQRLELGALLGGLGAGVATVSAAAAAVFAKALTEVPVHDAHATVAVGLTYLLGLAAAAAAAALLAWGVERR